MFRAAVLSSFGEAFRDHSPGLYLGGDLGSSGFVVVTSIVAGQVDQIQDKILSTQ